MKIENPIGYCTAIANKRTRFRILREDIPKDYTQTLWVAWLSGAKGKSLARVIDKELWRLGRDHGYFIQTNQTDNHKHECGCKNCTNPGVYKDEKYKYLCRRHWSIVHKRRQRGWSDPYYNLDETRRLKITKDYMPSRNKRLWSTIRKHVTDDQWEEIWLWATGKGPRPSKLINKLRDIAKTL